MLELTRILAPINEGAGTTCVPQDFKKYVEGVFLPLRRKGWKQSTNATNTERITAHLISKFRDRRIAEITRENLQRLLDEKVAAKTEQRAPRGCGTARDGEGRRRVDGGVEGHEAGRAGVSLGARHVRNNFLRRHLRPKLEKAGLGRDYVPGSAAHAGQLGTQRGNRSEGRSRSARSRNRRFVEHVHDDGSRRTPSRGRATRTVVEPGIGMTGVEALDFGFWVIEVKEVGKLDRIALSV